MASSVSSSHNALILERPILVDCRRKLLGAYLPFVPVSASDSLLQERTIRHLSILKRRVSGPDYSAHRNLVPIPQD
jgi:chloramphenicol 3-O-phosphotransferase